MTAKLYEPLQLELSNGIPVILQHYDGPVAATYWWVNTGSTDEGPKETGFAHFLEHMLFKDAAAKESGKASTGQTARLIESLGGDINAYTSFDHTVYHVTCAAHHWEKVLDHFGPMGKPQRFLAKDFQREREVILEELRKNEDSPGRQLFQQLFTTTFSQHPYGRPVIGYEKILRGAKLSQLEAFYKQYYASGRMGLILVGPLSDPERRKSILERLELYFGKKVLRPKTAARVSRSVEQQLRSKAEWRVRRFDVKSPTLNFSFRVPDLEHEDMPALDLLSGILSMGELSRLYQGLFYEKSLVTDISGGIYVPKDPGMVYFQAEVESPERLEPVVREMFSELKRMVDQGPTQEEVARVLVNAESERLYATQTADGMASRLGFLRFVVGDLEFDQEYLEKLQAVTLSQIQAVAKRYLEYRRMSGVVLLPQAAADIDLSVFEKMAEELLPGGGKQEVAPKPSAKVSLPKKEIDPLVSFNLPSGITVRYFARPQSHVFSIHASVLGGLRLEIASPIERADSDWGASALLALTWAKGTSKLDARAIAAATEGRAAGLEGFSGRNSVGLQMTGLARDWDDLSSLFTEVLFDPTFAKEEVDHARRIVEDSIKSVEDHSSQLCSKLFLETLFETHPYGRMTHGSLESLRHIHPEKLRAFHKAWVRPERLVISVSGPVKKSVLESWLRQLEIRANELVGKNSPFDLAGVLPSEAMLRAPRWVERALGREQFHILMGGLGTQIYSEDRFSLRLLQTLLGGQSGRLFIELREKKSLAYTVSPVSFEGMERGYVGVYIACAPQKRAEAEKGVKTVLERLVQKGPSAQEMNRAKEFFLGRRAMDLQSDSSIASHYGLEALYRLENMRESDLIKKIHAIRSKDVQEVCRKYLVAPHLVTSVVG